MADEIRCAGGCELCEEECVYSAEGATVTLSLDDGSALECAVLTIYRAAGRQYIALLPLDENGENQDGEVFSYRFSVKGADEEPLLENIEDDDEFEAASDGFDEWLDSQEYDELIYDDEEEDREEL